MDIKVYENKSGEVYVQLAKMSQTYKLLRSFIKASMTTTPDASVKMVVTMLDKAFDMPEALDSPISGARNNNNASDGGLSQNMLTNLNTKLDLVFKSIGALQNAKTTTVKTELDQSLWDGLIHRIEEILHNVLDAKLSAISNSGFVAQSATAEDNTLFTKLLAEISEIKKIAIQSSNTSHVMHSVSSITQLPVATDATLPATSQEPASTQNNKIIANKAKEEVELNVPAPNQAVACDDRIRYPSPNKKTRPTCFGNFLSGKNLQETPCLSCAWINDCQIKPDSKTPADNARPDCFGSHRHDLDCGVCPHDQDCLGASF